jgi:RimJ/RimL family protein N-acetyltransferase
MAMRRSSILPLETERLILRNWHDADRALFHEVNSDEDVMAFFAFRRDRAASDSTLDRISAAIAENGYGWSAVERKSDGACLGICGLSPLTIQPHLPEGTVEIGWRLAKRHWGAGYVTEAARALVDAAFTRLHLRELVAIAVPENQRSTAVMARLGMVRDMAGDFDHPGVPETRPSLRRHGTWRISHARWGLLNRRG